jgi:hypothetical protein
MRDDLIQLSPAPTATVLQGPFSPNGGRGWVVDLPAPVPASDPSEQWPFLSLYEDDRPLGPARTRHPDIREQGGGAFSHWGTHLYFSASDNSDPNANGRRYAFSVDDGLLRQYAEDAALQAISTVEVWLMRLDPAYDLRGKTVCELGPGQGCCASLVLRGLGADGMVVDRVAPQWNSAFHALVVEALCRLAPQRLGRPFFPERLRQCVEAEDFCFAQVHADGLESAGEALRETADVTLSASVLEHVEDMAASIEAIHLMTRPGGLGIHCIDLRDHADFSRPLEFLLFPQEDYGASQAYKYERGNRVRAAELMRIVDRFGFSAAEFIGFQQAELHYRVDILRRLEFVSPVRDSLQDLRWLNGVLRLAKS